MGVRVQCAWAPKEGASVQEYEDAYYVPAGSRQQDGPFRLAVADGATESAFAKVWAQTLVSAYGEGRLREGELGGELHGLGRRWWQRVTSRPLPWYVEQKVGEGAHAAFAGVEIASGRCAAGYGMWRGLGIGDSCVFHVRGDRLMRCVPVSVSAQFGSRPLLVPTARKDIGRALKYFWCRGGIWRRGDGLILMTDAMAQWFLHSAEGGGQPWRVVERLCQASESAVFGRWLTQARARGSLHNDDVTIVWASFR